MYSLSRMKFVSYLLQNNYIYKVVRDDGKNNFEENTLLKKELEYENYFCGVCKMIIK